MPIFPPFLRPRLCFISGISISASTLRPLTHHQPLSTTSIVSGRHSKVALKILLKDVPRYPFPIKHTFKQSWFGLYDGKHIQFGNNVPDNKYSPRTRRTWKPNVKTKKLYSQAMGKFIQMRVTTSVLRTIDKVGGLDEYLLSSKSARLKSLGPYGWKLRYDLMKTPAIQSRFRKERKALGLVPPPKQKSKSKKKRGQPNETPTIDPAAQSHAPTQLSPQEVKLQG